MATTALIPTLEQDYKRQEKVIDEVNEAQAGLTAADRAVATLADSEGWHEVEAYINRKIEQLQDYLDQAIANGSDFVQIGQRAMVLSLCRDELSGVVNYVKSKYLAVNGDLEQETAAQ